MQFRSIQPPIACTEFSMPAIANAAVYAPDLSVQAQAFAAGKSKKQSLI
jgi:hypothetical protein